MNFILVVLCIIFVVAGIVLMYFAMKTFKDVDKANKKRYGALFVIACVCLIFSLYPLYQLYQNAEGRLDGSRSIVMVDEVFQNGISVVDPMIDNDTPRVILCTIEGIDEGDFVDTNGKLVLSGKSAVIEYCKIKGLSYGLLTANP